jgi:hypothetical protein
MKPVAALEFFLYDTASELIAPFAEDRKGLWGTMNATQMLEHLSLAVKASNGLLTAPSPDDPVRAEKVKRIALLSERPMPKDFNNPVLTLVPRSDTTIPHEEAKKMLQENIRLFRHSFEEGGPSLTHMHNIFGPLNYHEWLFFHYKHFHHHFAQFGIVPYEERFSLE